MYINMKLVTFFFPVYVKWLLGQEKNLGRDLILSIGELIGSLVHCGVQNTAKFNKIQNRVQNSAEYSIHTKSLIRSRNVFKQVIKEMSLQGGWKVILFYL